MYEVFGFYRFLNIKYLKKNKRLINDVLIKNNIRGTIIISKEGVNGTVLFLVKNHILKLLLIS